MTGYLYVYVCPDIIPNNLLYTIVFLCAHVRVCESCLHVLHAIPSVSGARTCFCIALLNNRCIPEYPQYYTDYQATLAWNLRDMFVFGMITFHLEQLHGYSWIHVSDGRMWTFLSWFIQLLCSTTHTVVFSIVKYCNNLRKTVLFSTCITSNSCVNSTNCTGVGRNWWCFKICCLGWCCFL